MILKNFKSSPNEEGFSLIDVVVSIAIIVALSVGIFVAYQALTETIQKEEKKITKEDPDFVKDPEHVSPDEKFRK